MVSYVGPCDASGVVVLDALPSGYTYISDDSGGTYNAATGQWNVGTVPLSSSIALNVSLCCVEAGTANCPPLIGVSGLRLYALRSCTPHKHELSVRNAALHSV